MSRSPPEFDPGVPEPVPLRLDVDDERVAGEALPDVEARVGASLRERVVELTVDESNA